MKSRMGDEKNFLFVLRKKKILFLRVKKIFFLYGVGKIFYFGDISGKLF